MFQSPTHSPHLPSLPTQYTATCKTQASPLAFQFNIVHSYAYTLFQYTINIVHSYAYTLFQYTINIVHFYAYTLFQYTINHPQYQQMLRNVQRHFYTVQLNKSKVTTRDSVYAAMRIKM